MEKDDVQLIQRILAGDESALGDLVQKHQKSVHAVAWREIGDFHYLSSVSKPNPLGLGCRNGKRT